MKNIKTFIDRCEGYHKTIKEFRLEMLRMFDEGEKMLIEAHKRSKKIEESKDETS